MWSVMKLTYRQPRVLCASTHHFGKLYIKRSLPYLARPEQRLLSFRYLLHVIWFNVALSYKSTSVLLSSHLHLCISMSFFSHVRVPSLSSVYFRDDRVPDVGADYSRLSALKRYQWSRQEKEVLYLMSDFDNSSIQLWAIFRAYFAEKYSKAPKPRKPAWEAMRNYLAHKARHSKQSTHSFALRRAKARISSVAVSIGIQLHTKAQTGPVAKSRLQKQKKAPSPDRSDTSPSENDWSSDGSNYFDDVTDQSPAILIPPELHSTPSASRVFPLGGLLTPPSTDRKEHRIWGTQGGETDEGVPQLAFRGKLSW